MNDRIRKQKLHKAAVQQMVVHVISILQYWSFQPGDNDAIATAIAVFDELTMSYVCSHLLVQIDFTKALMMNHAMSTAAFLQVPALGSQRTAWYACLSRLLARDDLLEHVFEHFMLPVDSVAAAITKEAVSTREGMRCDRVREIGKNLCVDLEGVLRGLYKKEGYQRFFDWLYPKKLQLIVRCAKRGGTTSR